MQLTSTVIGNIHCATRFSDAVFFQSFQFAIWNVNLSLHMKTLSGELPIDELVQHIPFFFETSSFLPKACLFWIMDF